MVPFDETVYPTSKRVGAVSEVTLVTPIKEGRVEGEYRTYRQRLEDVLDDVQQRELGRLPTPVGLLRQIHFARWVILEAPGRAGDLLFTSNFDGEMKLYFRNFALELTSDIDSVWNNCEGYPGAHDFDRLWQYVKKHQITTRLFYSAYPTLTMPQIARLDALRKGFDDFLCKAGARLKLKAEIEENAESIERDFKALLESVRLEKPPIAPEQPKGAGTQPTNGRKLERSDIQANVLGSPPWKQAGYFFLTIEDPQVFRQGLCRLISLGEKIGFVTAEHFERHRPTKTLKSALNIAFTWSGLERLGLADEYLGGMPLAFRQGMADRAEILGDAGEWAPNRWDGALGRKGVHVLIAAFCTDGKVDDYWKEICKDAQADAELGSGSDFIGCALIHKEVGLRLEREVEGGDDKEKERIFYEPFGFRDGVGQPVIEGGEPEQATTPWAIAAGEFLLGYRDVDGNDQISEDFVGAPFRTLCDNGTYMVFRKIEQHVAAFEEAAQDRELASRLVGRRHDGTSLAVDHARALADKNRDGFDYSDDPKGEKCPFASHARRTNPRNEESRRHRIIRRGIPYNNGVDKQGMLFVCFNARIESQFEFLQSEWCKKGDFLGYFTDARDPTVGGGGSFVDPRKPLPYGLKSFVTVKGGDYFFLPGVAALDGIARGAFDKPLVALPLLKPAAAPPADMFDPVGYANEELMIGLLAARRIEKKEVAWPSGRRQAVYYVACRDHLRKILADDATFTSDPYARKLQLLLSDYDHRFWLRAGETKGSEGALFSRFMLGMLGEDPEKKARLQALKRALAASNVEDIRKRIAKGVGPIAKELVERAVSDGEKTGGFDIVARFAYAVPLECAVRRLGFPDSTEFSDAYKALYFQRTSIEEVRSLGFQFPDCPYPSALPSELYGLVHPIAVFLLIDQYDTPSALAFARVAVKEFLDRLGKEVLAEQDRIASNEPGGTLLSLLLRQPADGEDDITFRARSGMIMAELIVGGIDTTAKGITNVVDCLLSNPRAMKATKEAVAAGDDSKLDDLILEALRLEPVAELIVRECPKGAVVQLNDGRFQFEADSRLFLCPPAAMRDPGAEPLPPDVDLQKFVLNEGYAVRRALHPIRRLAFGDGAHGCLGGEIVLAEIREVLKQLVTLKNLRRAAGPTGTKQERFNLPVSLEVRFDP